MSNERSRPGNRPVEQQERPAADVEQTRLDRVAVSGPGAADFLTAQGGLDRPESGGKGMGQARGEGLLDDPHRLVPRVGPDTEAYPGERTPDEDSSGSQSGTIGGGGPDAHNPSPVRATGVDDPTASDPDEKPAA
jgi:hypothetical protein